MKNRFFNLLLIFIILGSQACKKTYLVSVSSNPEAFKHLVSGFNSGQQKRSEAIRIFLSAEPNNKNFKKTALNPSMLTIEPKLAGELKWSEPNIIEFYPASADIKTDQVYEVKLALKEIFENVPDSIGVLAFSVSYLPLQLSVEFDFLRPDPSNPEFMYLTGKVRCTEAINLVDLIEHIKFSQDKGGVLKPSFEKDPNSSEEVFFKLSEIRRNTNSTFVNMEWYEKPEKKELLRSKKLEVPAKDEFIITGIRQNNESERSFTVYFSDPLSTTQDVSGFCQIQKNTQVLNIKKEMDHIQIFVPEMLAQNSGNLVISNKFQNTKGKKLATDFTYAFNFEEQKPQLKFNNKSANSILPYTDEVLLPFEAVNLNAVDVEIFKIFSSNVLYNMHMDYSYDIYNLVKLGRVIHQQHIDLSSLNSESNKKDWKKYALDLKKMIDAEPGALYEIRLTFLPSYTSYYCATGKPVIPSTDQYNYSGDPNIISNWKDYWYHDENDTGNENNNNEDPCSRQYYRSERFIRKTILASNIALMAKSSLTGKQTYAAVYDILNGAPISGAQVKFYDAQLQELVTQTTDQHGVIMPETSRAVNYVIAQHGKNYSYLKLAEGMSISLSEFEVAGVSSKDGMKASIYCERGVWRPGDSIFLNTILYQSGIRIPNNLALELKLKNPKGQVVYSEMKNTNLMGLFSFTIPTLPSFLTGNYIAELKVGASTFEKKLKIETIKPNRFNIQWNIAQGSEIEKDQDLKLKVSWLHGAVAGGMKTKVDARYHLMEPEFKTHKNYVFLNPEVSHFSGEAILFDGNLNDQGETDIQLTNIQQSENSGKLACSLISKVFDPGGDISTDYFDATISNFNEYVGISLPESPYGKRMEVFSDQIMRCVVLDSKGKAVANRDLKLELYRVEWQWWYEVRNGNGHYSHHDYKTLIETKTGKTDVNGLTEIKFYFKDYQRYFVKVTNTKNGYTTGDFFYTGWPYDESSGSKEFANIINFKTDKEKYQAGESAKVILPGAKNAKYLISIIRENKILKHVQIPSQENQTEYKFEVTPDMIPNVYLDVTMIQSAKGISNDLPLRMYGVVPVLVEDENRRLLPEIKAKDQVKTDENFTVEVSEKKGKVMAYHLFIVDEGLLSITRFKTPNPYDDLFQKEALTMMTWDNYEDIIGSAGNDIFKVFSIGGDEAISAADAAKMNRFRPVILRSGPMSLAKGEKKTHTFKIANYTGAVRAFVVANNEMSFGSAEKEIKVKKELMTQITLPRVIAVTDQLAVPVTVFSTDPGIRDVNVSLSVTGNLTIVGESTKIISFTKEGDQTVFFNVKAINKVGPASVKAIVKSQQFSAEHVIETYTDNPNPMTHTVKSFWLEPGQKIQEKIPVYGMDGSRSVSLEVSGFQGVSLNKYLSQLVAYPHGCAEQIISKAFPQIYLSQLLDLSLEQKTSVNQHVEYTLDRLRSYQHSDGSFEYWPGSDESFDWLSSYAGHFLIEARNQGYRIQDDMLRNWYSHQRSKANAHSKTKNKYSEVIQAYRLYTLALYQKPEWASMNRMVQDKHDQVLTSYLLAGAYGLSGRKETAEKLISGIKISIADYTDSYYTYGTPIRDEAMISLLLLNLDKKTEAFQLMNRLIQKLSNEAQLNTQEMSFVLCGFSKLYPSNGSAQAAKFSYSWNGSNKDIQQNTPFYSTDLDDASIQDFQFSNKSSVPLYVQLVQSGKTIGTEKVNEARGISIAVHYYSNNKTADLNQLKSGDELVAQITVTNDGSKGHLFNLALTSVFPSGFEITNTRIGGLTQTNSLLDYIDYRDDRVHAYFSLGIGKSVTVQIPMVAAYVGTYQSPEQFCEAMYDPSCYARYRKGTATIRSVR
ncbi:MAG: MG2 domain-containing protein [Bacteroidota bacterium]|nr:MG2 domain-containing protein [Bacteroidota bacterium]